MLSSGEGSKEGTSSEIAGNYEAHKIERAMPMP